MERMVGLIPNEHEMFAAGGLKLALGLAPDGLCLRNHRRQHLGYRDAEDGQKKGSENKNPVRSIPPLKRPDESQAVHDDQEEYRKKRRGVVGEKEWVQANSSNHEHCRKQERAQMTLSP